MLDAILITDNPYTNSTAIGVGYAIKNSKFIIKSGNYWKYGSSYVDKDLVSRSSSHIRPIGSSYSGYYAIPITSNPYRTSNSLANSAGYALWGNNLMHKSGNIWKYQSTGANYNPCSSPYTDGVDYSNLKCKDNYTWTTGYLYGNGSYWSEGTENRQWWNGKSVPSGYTKKKGAFRRGIDRSAGYSWEYEIKISQNRNRYKSFTDF